MGMYARLLSGAKLVCLNQASATSHIHARSSLAITIHQYDIRTIEHKTANEVFSTTCSATIISITNALGKFITSAETNSR
jgi:hypothetical protein